MSQILSIYSYSVRKVRASKRQPSEPKPAAVTGDVKSTKMSSEHEYEKMSSEHQYEKIKRDQVTEDVYEIPAIYETPAV